MTATATTTATDWVRCPGCEILLYDKRVADTGRVCPDCDHHFRLSAAERLDLLADEGSVRRFCADLEPGDPLGFSDSKPYPRRLAAARGKTGLPDAAVCATATIQGHPVVLAVLDFGFMGGSVGGVVGELVCRAARRALRTRTPLLIVTASGGARMQEGCLSLMQMARTAQDIARLHEQGVLVLNLNCDPTFGGATASFATLGDIVLAEPGALIGFAGPNVIRQTIRQELPAGFQTAEFLHEHGILDLVVPRGRLRDVLGSLLDLDAERVLPAPESTSTTVTDPDALPPAEPAELVALAREGGRPTTLDYLELGFDDFVELHGDGMLADDPAVVGGLGRLAGRSVVVIGHQKGRDTQDRVRRNFAMPNPEGYRKAMRLMRLAATLRLPLVTLVDTPGAYPGIQAEEHGQGSAIARCIMTMARLPVPVVSVVTGEGGSGGALALAVADDVLILRHAYYSVISPEGCSTILFGRADAADRAAESLRLRPADLLRLGVVDGVVPEPDGGAHTDVQRTALAVRDALAAALARHDGVPGAVLVERRYRRFERFGGFGGDDS
jgi:acetyl-CoA carboxylase carboxyl transferase beta subunit/acetyl-CoA carboxylase carboxyl transferase alpha subunit